VSAAQAQETERLAQKHGFHLAGYRSFEKAVTEQAIEDTRNRAAAKRGL